MYKAVLSCSGVSEAIGLQGAADVEDDFTHRPWHHDVSCRWAEGRLVIEGTNDFDPDGKAFLDEFSDAVCACLPIEGSTIRFTVETVQELAPNCLTRRSSGPLRGR